MGRFPVCCLALLIVIAGVLYAVAIPTRVTLGQLAESPDSFDGRKILLRNTGAGLAGGRYRWFPSPVSTRVPVVLILADPDVSCEGINCYSGYCLGTCDDPIPGLPVPPPFVLILRARPVP